MYVLKYIKQIPSFPGVEAFLFLTSSLSLLSSSSLFSAG